MKTTITRSSFFSPLLHLMLTLLLVNTGIAQNEAERLFVRVNGTDDVRELIYLLDFSVELREYEIENGALPGSDPDDSGDPITAADVFNVIQAKLLASSNEVTGPLINRVLDENLERLQRFEAEKARRDANSASNRQQPRYADDNDNNAFPALSNENQSASSSSSAAANPSEGQYASASDAIFDPERAAMLSVNDNNANTPANSNDSNEQQNQRPANDQYGSLSDVRDPNDNATPQAGQYQSFAGLQQANNQYGEGPQLVDDNDNNAGASSSSSQSQASATNALPQDGQYQSFAGLQQNDVNDPYGIVPPLRDDSDDNNDSDSALGSDASDDQNQRPSNANYGSVSAAQQAGESASSSSSSSSSANANADSDSDANRREGDGIYGNVNFENYASFEEVLQQGLARDLANASNDEERAQIQQNYDELLASRLQEAEVSLNDEGRANELNRAGEIARQRRLEAKQRREAERQRKEAEAAAERQAAEDKKNEREERRDDDKNRR